MSDPAGHDLVEALRAAQKGLEAGIRQYAARNWQGNEVPGDEQYAWVRLMQIGRDAVLAALASEAASQVPADEPYVYGELLWYDCGDGRRLNAQYRGLDEGWIIAAFADGSKASVRPSRLARRAAEPDQEGPADGKCEELKP